ncbi:hypothetical protein C0993_004788 [Termitomyces sp. T159_Od127]|nr:hypothetical protein C0993_004788 [Termitomyces sp. T159_Od127]
MPMTPSVPEVAIAPSMAEQVASMVFDALQKDLMGQVRAQVQASLEDMQNSMAMLTASVSNTRGQLEVLAAHVANMEQTPCVSGPRPSISLPEKYDGVLKSLADQFVWQVEAAAEFEVFWNERQKILWAQLYLMGLAQAWSCIITTGLDDKAANPQHFRWAAWLADFKAAFGMHDPAQDTLNHIAVLQQGSKSIMEYCTAFFELKGWLSPLDAASNYVKDRF